MGGLNIGAICKGIIMFAKRFVRKKQADSMADSVPLSLDQYELDPSWDLEAEPDTDQAGDPFDPRQLTDLVSRFDDLPGHTVVGFDTYPDNRVTLHIENSRGQVFHDHFVYSRANKSWKRVYVAKVTIRAKRKVAMGSKLDALMQQLDDRVQDALVGYDYPPNKEEAIARQMAEQFSIDQAGLISTAFREDFLASYLPSLHDAWDMRVESSLKPVRAKRKTQ